MLREQGLELRGGLVPVTAPLERGRQRELQALRLSEPGERRPRQLDDVGVALHPLERAERCQHLVLAAREQRFEKRAGALVLAARETELGLERRPCPARAGFGNRLSCSEELDALPVRLAGPEVTRPQRQ